MARNAAILVLRITRAQLDTAAGLGQLLTGEPYLITDEERFAVALSPSTYESYAKLSEAGGGSAPLSGVATITLPSGEGAYEDTETVAALGVTPTSKVFLSLAPALDEDENDPSMLDIVSMSAIPGTDTLTINATFSQLTSGPVKFNWSAING